ncbi:MAG: helix-turn-helix domain-containing protein [Micrococcales bacterium]|nr:helix-turn-helix domain-containing protein [Micrococcales bacterium]
MSDEAGAGRLEASKTLDRGIRVLEVLARAEHGRGLTVTELAAELGIGRPAVYRLVTTLEEHHLIVRRSDGRMRMGLGIRRLAAAVTPIIRSETRPILRELADVIGATAHLTVAEGDEALGLVVIEPSWTVLHVAYRAGSRHPLEVGAAGRAILAGRAGLDEVVSSDGELQSGAHGMALAVAPAGEPGAVEASVGVVSLSPLDPEVVAPRLRAAARAIAAIVR